MEDRSGLFLLAAVGAKYIHSNLAVYSLDAYCRERGYRTQAAEYTINQPAAEILRDIYLRHPAVAGFSCYIWNMTRILEIIRQLHQILPDTLIVLGGPEVSWNPEERLMELP
ncbi:MAG: cobalamin B12-binding domain-containing protein, partial [Lachnospiraceae bacterium]|nr:cobalamin B12-binding domain-containing protein [Lachnospiraceae bacterium]